MATFIRIIFFTFLFVRGANLLASEDEFTSLMNDLMIVDWVNQKIYDRFPVTYNYYQQGGYLIMPSARMGAEGEISLGYSQIPPYRVWNGRAQVFDYLEISANYRIFCGILDPVFGHMGFGEFSDKGANLKLALLHPEDSDYVLPGIAIGWDDFLGTKSFSSKYIVATQVLPQMNMEFSLGFGTGRINGIFGGLNWMPWRKRNASSLRNITLTLEYDGTDYLDPDTEPHPDGRFQSSKLNYGFKYRLCDYFDLSASYIRGETYAFSLSGWYNFGNTNGLLPKIHDSLPYTTPKNNQAIGVWRPEEVVVQDLLYAMGSQGFKLLKAFFSIDLCGQRILRLKVYNCKWIFERQVRCRLNHLLSSLSPSNIDQIIVEMESEGFPIQEYHYHTTILQLYSERRINDYTLNLMTPMTDITIPSSCYTERLFSESRELFQPLLYPKVQTFFGSTTGKFKFALGVNFGACGFLPGDIYYHVLLGYVALSKLTDQIGVDRLNPSQIINVHTDIVCYFAERELTFDVMYLQKNWNLFNGIYSRITLGYFSQNYLGIGSEILYYPLNSRFAIGLDAAVVKKRTLTGLGYTNEIRKFVGFAPTYVPFTGFQWFVDLYYEPTEWQLDLRMSGGRFLAGDIGVRWEVTRYFCSGLRLSAWYTYTDGHDHLNGQIYYDKGVALSMPLDFFYTYSCRGRWEYGMSAWLRDVGYRTNNGLRLYDLIHDQRIR